MDKRVQIKDVLLLNERVFSTCGSWPLGTSYVKFAMYTCYLSVHLVIMNMDLYDAMGDLEHMVENILDNTVMTTTYFMLFLYRFSKMIKIVIRTIKQDLVKQKFRNKDEMQLYLSYNNISDTFGKYSVTITIMVVVMLYITPMLELLQSSSDKALLHMNSVGMLFNLALHVCGKLAILSYRIRNIAEDSTRSFQLKVKEIVEKHVQLIMMTNTLNSALQIILVIELIQTSIRMAVIVYTILLSDDIVDIITYSLYVILVTSLLYLYSYMGERLQYESEKVNDAYYDANWLKLSIRDQQFLLQCMTSGRKTLHLTAGNVYTFSLSGFIQIMKTCFGYVSLLRALI